MAGIGAGGLRRQERYKAHHRGDVATQVIRLPNEHAPV
jgi:hypothetical protein